jgi:hypothetical protein
MNVLRYFEQNKMDSLKIIFPTYQKYAGILKEAVQKKNHKDYETTTYYYPHFVNSIYSQAIADIHAKNLAGVQLTFKYPTHSFNAKISMVEIKRLKPTKEQNEDQIIEIGGQ